MKHLHIPLTVMTLALAACGTDKYGNHTVLGLCPKTGEVVIGGKSTSDTKGNSNEVNGSITWKFEQCPKPEQKASMQKAITGLETEKAKVDAKLETPAAFQKKVGAVAAAFKQIETLQKQRANETIQTREVELALDATAVPKDAYFVAKQEITFTLPEKMNETILNLTPVTGKKPNKKYRTKTVSREQALNNAWKNLEEVASKLH